MGKCIEIRQAGPDDPIYKEGLTVSKASHSRPGRLPRKPRKEKPEQRDQGREGK